MYSQPVSTNIGIWTLFIDMSTYAVVSEVIFRMWIFSDTFPSICMVSGKAIPCSCIRSAPSAGPRISQGSMGGWVSREESGDGCAEIEDGDRDGRFESGGLSELSVEC